MVAAVQKTRAGSYRINLIAQALGRFLSIGTILFIFMLAARLLDMSSFGQFSYIITFLGLTATIAEFGTTSICAKELSQHRENDNEYWANFILLRLGLSLAVMLPAIFVAYRTEQHLFPYLVAGCLGLPFIASRFFDPVFQIYDRPWYSTISSVSYSTAYLAATFLFIAFHKGIWSFLSAYLTANILYATLASALAGKLLRPRFVFRWNIILHTLKLAWPLGAAMLIVQINTRADIFMLAWLQSDNEVAIYNAAYRFLDLAATLAIILSNPILPIFSKDALGDRKKLRENYIQIFETVCLLTIPVAILTPYLSPSLVQFIFGAPFLPSAAVVNILAWVGVLVFLSLLSMVLCIAIGVVHFGWWNAALAASVNILLNLWWIPKYSYIGSAWATLICEILLLGVSLIFITKYLGTIFRIRFWVKVAAVNILLYAILFYLPLKNPITIICILFGYSILMFLLNLIPKRLLLDLLTRLKRG